MAYTVLPYSYQASFHNAYRCLCHAHYHYRPQLPYKSHKTYLTNHMESISCHIMPLVINNLRADTHANIHTHTHTCKHTFMDRSNSKKPGTVCAVLYLTTPQQAMVYSVNPSKGIQCIFNYCL